MSYHEKEDYYKKSDGKYPQPDSSRHYPGTEAPYDKDLLSEITFDGDPGNRTCFEIMACERHVNKEFKVSLPVSIRPIVMPQKPDVECLGDVEVHPGFRRCRRPRDVIRFTVSQDISVKIPIQYRTKTCYGRECIEETDDPGVDCEE